MRPLTVLARPWTERRFVHADYERLLDGLTDSSRFLVVPLREFATAPRDRVVVGLRHDIEERFQSALEMGALEAERGLRATYFILHTARYYARMGWRRSQHDESLIPGLRRLQEMGHEVGWHNDLVTLQAVHGIEPRQYLAAELEWLRGHGIDVRGAASHGSYWAHRLSYHNNYFFEDFDELHEGFPNTDAVQVGERRCQLSKGRLREFGFEYEAYHLGEDHYFSDARFDAAGHRWHTDAIDLARLEPGDRAIVLTHPDYWDPSVTRKALRTVVWSARRLVVGERSWRIH
ncbi:MAG: hypothetical protein QOK25_1949 [Thermoleophilaceae bacterium]|nr:hypothetical protein [Thermoleophilaceae bacterium]